ncbi:hypothetical protein DENSPDRAFT_761664, partial [Dentipellis sp. KUC8613]
SPPPPCPDHFIAQALQRAQLPPCTVFAALYFLQCIKSTWPPARGMYSLLAFIPALMVATKMICTASYSITEWCTIAQDLLTPHAMIKIEQQLYWLLGPDVEIEPSVLAQFE